VRYLTVEEVLEINAEVMGGKHTLRDRGLLESAVARPQASAFGVDAYPDLASKAAALLHSLILNHAFVDGNKRTAVLSTEDAVTFLRSRMHPKDITAPHPSTQ